VRQVKPSHVNCVYVRQPEALGLGDAVHCAKNLIGDDAFAVLLADDLLDSDPPVLSQMMAVHQHYQSSVVAVQAIQPEQSTSYGVISGKAFDERLTKMSGVIEKPSPSSAPSNLGVVGRYIFTPAIFKHIQTVQPDADGEFQLTDAIQSLLQEQLVLAYQYEGVRYDCGMKLDYLKESVDIALAHPELQDEFKAYLANKLALTVTKSVLRTLNTLDIPLNNITTLLGIFLTCFTLSFQVVFYVSSCTVEGRWYCFVP
jgi:UTP--glucose-1-phosphate uridylyltransferase